MTSVLIKIYRLGYQYKPKVHWYELFAGPVKQLVDQSRSRDRKKLKVEYISSNFSIPDTYNKKKYTMKSSEVKRSAALYKNHLK